jgi:hypothetical protein
VDKAIRYFVDTQTSHENHNNDPQLQFFIEPWSLRISNSQFGLPPLYQLIHDNEGHFMLHIQRQVLSQQLYIVMNPTTVSLISNCRGIWDEILQHNCYRDYRGHPRVKHLLIYELAKLQQQAMSLELLHDFDQDTSSPEWVVKQLRHQDRQLYKCIRFASRNSYVTDKFQSMAARVVWLTIATIRQQHHESTIWTAITNGYLNEEGFRTYAYLMESVLNLQIRRDPQDVNLDGARLMETLHLTVSRMPNGIRGGYQAWLEDILEQYHG